MYLYGVEKATWLDMKYKDAFILKNKLADKVLSEILEVDYRDRDTVRMGEVIKAIKYNKKRLAE